MEVSRTQEVGTLRSYQSGQHKILDPTIFQTCAAVRSQVQREVDTCMHLSKERGLALQYHKYHHSLSNATYIHTSTAP